jgi:hypothetical protein
MEWRAPPPRQRPEAPSVSTLPPLPEGLERGGFMDSSRAHQPIVAEPPAPAVPPRKLAADETVVETVEIPDVPEDRDRQPRVQSSNG